MSIFRWLISRLNRFGHHMTEADTTNRIVFREVTLERWSDFERLFERRGGPKSCWCMVWRATPEEAKHKDAASRKAAMAKRIAAGVTVGLLGYLDEEPIAWCSVAPRSTYRRLVNNGSSDDGIWSITCFFVVRSLRGQGITKRIVSAAVNFAKSEGARVVEAYPVDPGSPSYRFMGFVQTFKAEGFCEVGHIGKRRHVFQLKVE
jgi:GNAT superfamily N-acetyltransferase